MLLKNDKNGWIQETVHAAVIEKTALVIFGRGAEIGRIASCKISHQYFGEKHGLDRRTDSTVVIRICSIPCKVTSYKEERHKGKRPHYKFNIIEVYLVVLMPNKDWEDQNSNPYWFGPVTTSQLGEDKTGEKDYVCQPNFLDTRI